MREPGLKAALALVAVVGMAAPMLAAGDAATSQASDPNREAPPDGGDGSRGAAGNVGGYNSFWIDNGTDVFEVDGKFRTSIITHPKNGRFPPVTEAVRQLAASRRGFFRATVEDPNVWTESWSGEYVWPRTDTLLYEYACHEGNYALGNIMRGARLLEEEATAKAASSGGSGE